MTTKNSRNPLSKWRHSIPLKERGVITGGDHQIEFLIPWWFDCFKKRSNVPVLFFDLGLSDKGRDWVAKQCEVLSMDIPKEAFAKRFLQKEASFETAGETTRIFRENMRIAWFKKPFALLASPYKQSLWLDIDCEVVKDISPIFNFAEKSPSLTALTKAAEHIAALKKARGFIAEEVVDYNAGVIPFIHGSPLVSSWAETTLESDLYFPGDQEVLSYTIFEKQYRVKELPRIYNWQIPDWGTNRGAVIQHWKGGKAKQFLFKKVIAKNKELLVLTE